MPQTNDSLGHNSATTRLKPDSERKTFQPRTCSEIAQVLQQTRRPIGTRGARILNDDLGLLCHVPKAQVQVEPKGMSRGTSGGQCRCGTDGRVNAHTTTILVESNGLAKDFDTVRNVGVTDVRHF